jgi:methionyl-tRNA formyltransferase
MTRLDAIGIVLADTSRTRVYLQALAAHGFAPAEALVLTSPSSRPGQVSDEAAKPYQASWGRVDLGLSAIRSLDDAAVSRREFASGDINGADVIEALAASPCEVFIYSGFGGVILRAPVLSCGKRFLHVHGGYLPDYKGSTTNYYSYLADGECGASAIFITEQIDSGPVLMHKKFTPQADLLELDHALDSCFRAQVLCETLALYSRTGHWPEVSCGETGRTYYIMHPLLRHAAICKSMRSHHV